MGASYRSRMWPMLLDPPVTDTPDWVGVADSAFQELTGKRPAEAPLAWRCFLRVVRSVGDTGSLKEWLERADALAEPERGDERSQRHRAAESIWRLVEAQRRQQRAWQRPRDERAQAAAREASTWMVGYPADETGRFDGLETIRYALGLVEPRLSEVTAKEVEQALAFVKNRPGAVRALAVLALARRAWDVTRRPGESHEAAVERILNAWRVAENRRQNYYGGCKRQSAHGVRHDSRAHGDRPDRPSDTTQNRRRGR